MQLTVIGCAGSYPVPSSPASCYLITTHDATIVADLGNGALGPLQAAVDLTQIDAIVISHLHADHCIDLTALYGRLRYSPVPLTKRIPVYGPAGLSKRLRLAYSSQGDKDLTDIFEFRRLNPNTAFRVGSVQVSCAEVAHPGDSYALRFESDGRSLTYSGDTGECEALVRLAHESHIALFEAACLEPQPGQPPLAADLHMSGVGAGRMARRSQSDRLILTHFVGWNEHDGQHARELAEARTEFLGDIDVARQGAVWTV